MSSFHVFQMSQGYWIVQVLSAGTATGNRITDENGQGRRMKHEPQSTWNLPLNNWNLTYHSIYRAKT